LGAALVAYSFGAAFGFLIGAAFGAYSFRAALAVVAFFFGAAAGFATLAFVAFFATVFFSPVVMGAFTLVFFAVLAPAEAFFAVFAAVACFTTTFFSGAGALGFFGFVSAAVVVFFFASADSLYEFLQCCTTRKMCRCAHSCQVTVIKEVNVPWYAQNPPMLHHS
jgi:hypothetical protein